ncbi:hypothetical protein [Piscinibacter sakaiensis]
MSDVLPYSVTKRRFSRLSRVAGCAFVARSGIGVHNFVLSSIWKRSS